MRRKPYETDELFKILTERVYEKYPEIKEIIEYSLSEPLIYQLRSEQISPKITFDYGGNEGIYLNFCINGILADGPDERPRTILIGTIKTLYESDEAMFLMGKLSAALIIEMHEFIDDHLLDFTWTGFRISNENSTNAFNLFTSDKSDFSDVIRKYYKSAEGILITDLAERKTYRAKEDGEKIILGEEVRETEEN